MLRTLTLAAIVALGAASLAGVAAAPAAANDARSAKVYFQGGFHQKVYHQHRDWRSRRFHHWHPRGRFLARVRHGDVICFRAAHPRRWHRSDRHGYRFHHRYGQRLGYRAVRRLVRSGHGHVLRCFRRR